MAAVRVMLAAVWVLLAAAAVVGVVAMAVVAAGRGRRTPYRTRQVASWLGLGLALTYA